MRRAVMVVAGGIFAVVSVLGMTQSTSAIDVGGQYGVSEKQGYLSGGTGLKKPTTKCKSGGVYVRVLCGGMHKTTKSEFIAFVKNCLDRECSGSDAKQSQIAGSFIVYTMLGYNGSNNGTSRPFPLLSSSSAVVRRWEALLNDPNVTVENVPSKRYTTNSAYTLVGNQNDVVFYKGSGTADALVFKYRGKEVYVVKKDCANPVGGEGFPTGYYSMDPESRVWVPGMSGGDSQWNDAAERPSQQARVGVPVTFWHRLENTGNSAAGNLSTYMIYNELLSSPLPQGQSTPTTLPGSRVQLQSKDFAPGAVHYYHPSYESRGELNSIRLRWMPGPNDVGKWYCQRVASWMSDTSNVYRLSSPACVRVGASYELKPTTQVTTKIISESAESVDGISATINNSGQTASKPANYAVVRFVVPGGGHDDMTGGEFTIPRNPLNPGNLIPDWKCEVTREIGRRYGIRINDADCTGSELAANGSGIQIPVSSAWDMMSGKNSDDISTLKSTLAVGDKVCYVSMVSSYTPDKATDEFRYSTPACVLVAKSPKVQFWGGDVRAGAPVWGPSSTSGQVITRVTTINGRQYGSWAEYGIFATGPVISASGAGLSSAVNGRDPIGAAEYNALTFANSDGSIANRYGSFGSLVSMRLPDSFFTGGSMNAGPVRLDDLATGTYQVGDVSISGAVGQSKSIVIRSNGTVTISAAIQYDSGSIGDVRSTPQLVIIARNIVIDHTVERVDGWLIASGYISTCDMPGGVWPGNIAECNRPLRVNGPLVAERLYLRRTAGSERVNPGEPAEIINLRPDAYLWGYAKSRESGSIQTTYLRELPPRF